jgi:hypothetical protein
MSTIDYQLLTIKVNLKFYNLLATLGRKLGEDVFLQPPDHHCLLSDFGSVPGPVVVLGGSAVSYERGTTVVNWSAVTRKCISAFRGRRSAINDRTEHVINEPTRSKRRLHGVRTFFFSRRIMTACEHFRGWLVFKAHRLLYHSTLGLKVIKTKKTACFRVSGLGSRFRD